MLVLWIVEVWVGWCMVALGLARRIYFDSSTRGSNGKKRLGQ